MRQYNATSYIKDEVVRSMGVSVGELFTLVDFTSAEIESIVDMPVGATLTFDNVAVERIQDAPDEKRCPSCGQPLPE